MFPVWVYKIQGRSMFPTLSENQRIIVLRSFYKIVIGDIVVCTHPQTKRLLIKRITKIKNRSFFVEGDNKDESTDSREFGWIGKKDIVGKVIFPL